MVHATQWCAPHAGGATDLHTAVAVGVELHKHALKALEILLAQQWRPARLGGRRAILLCRGRPLLDGFLGGCIEAGHAGRRGDRAGTNDHQTRCRFVEYAVVLLRQRYEAHCAVKLGLVERIRVASNGAPDLSCMFQWIRADADACWMVCSKHRPGRGCFCSTLID